MKSVSNYAYPSHILQLCLMGIVVLLLSACGSSADNSSADEAVNMKIAKALYFDLKTPAGFYKESFQDDVFYSISHIKNTSLIPVIDRDESSSYELPSDDFVEALTWSDTAAEYQLSHEQLIDNTETWLYHQFTRFNPDYPQFINMHRVFKTSVLVRNGVVRSEEDSAYRGRITMLDLTAEKVRQIVEYLWTFTLSNNYSNAVISSYTTETENSFVHIMEQAKLDFSYSESCDLIKLYEIRYTVPKDSGFIWKEKTLMREFSAKRTGDYLEICE